MATERGEQFVSDPKEREEALSKVIRELEGGAPNFHPKVEGQPNIVPYDEFLRAKEKREQGLDVHHQIPNHPLPKIIPFEQRRAEAEKLISGGLKDVSAMEDFVSDNIEEGYEERKAA